MSDSRTSSSKETYTIWTKSLIFHGNGCTVYDSKGVIVYRVDNYGVKNSREVQLMDLEGNVLFSLKGKVRTCGSGCWYGYKGTSTKEMPWFQAKETKSCGILNRSPIRECKVIMGCDYARGTQESYKIEGKSGKSGFRVVEGGDGGGAVAEVKKKESWGGGGVLLGDDVLTLVVEPNVDHSLVMALVIVYGLMRNII
ncbi:protein LURP-one-related 3-like [Impatiens glandulifera]|uniref:protein LURP-one-related 3-like n=1 Tax=Impatiens glandulifera TaxID=253017 RepID=UPI001FB14635|nr:protein LURP-one-related 3-like [Impatiens glandulifera]